jgi:hypothetical protein
MYKNINHFATCVTCQYIQSIDQMFLAVTLPVADDE